MTDTFCHIKHKSSATSFWKCKSILTSSGPLSYRLHFSFALEPLLPKKLHTKSTDKLDRDDPERDRKDRKKEKRNSKHQEIFDREMKTTEILLQPAEAVILSETVLKKGPVLQFLQCVTFPLFLSFPFLSFFLFFFELICCYPKPLCILLLLSFLSYFTQEQWHFAVCVQGSQRVRRFHMFTSRFWHKAVLDWTILCIAMD